jgi:hypothetical protein
MKLADFRANFHFEKKAPLTFSLLFVLFVISFIAHISYLFLSTAVFGDAVNYAFIAKNLSHGSFNAVDPFWLNLFCYWQTLIAFFGFSMSTTAIISSFIPGLFLFIPITRIAHELYGKNVAFAAGLFASLHPRFIEYSANGYPETFYLFWLGYGLFFHMTKRPILSGISFAIVTSCRNEFILLFALLVVLIAWTQKNFYFLARSSISFLLTMITYVMLSFVTIHTTGLFQKSTNFAKQYSEQIDMRASARETYGLSNQVTSAPPLFKKIPQNIVYTIKKLPGVLLSPLALFALLLPFLVTLRPKKEEMPLWVVLFFPLVFYPLIQVEPRYLFSLLIPLHILGAAGLIACANFFMRPIATGFLFFLIIAPSLALAAYKGYTTEKNYTSHRQIGAWIQANIPENEQIAGCGYGWASTSCFIAGRNNIRRPFVENGEALVSFMKEKQIRWLILYEAYITQADYELLPYLTKDLPGLTKQYEIQDAAGLRIQIYHLNKL